MSDKPQVDKVSQSAPQKRGTPPKGRRFGEGQPNNKGGRLKSKDFAQEVRDFLREKDPKTHKIRVRTLMEDLATNPKGQAILLNYAYGKPIETVHVGGEENAPPIRVTFCIGEQDAP